MQKQAIGFVGFITLLVGVLCYRWYAVREDFYPLMAIYALCFGGSVLAIWSAHRLAGKLNPIWLVVGGVLLRACLLNSQPHLSEDVYRFLWDGHLWNHGIHPFAHTPRTVLETMQIPGITPEWYALLNSPNYHTVYPPLGQLLFRIAAYLAHGDIAHGIFLLQLLLLFSDILTLWVLHRFLQQTNPLWRTTGIALYALNPMLIIETVGNCHFEGMMAGCILATLLLLHSKRDLWAGTWWAAGVAVKLLPLLFLPMVAGWLGIARTKRFALGFASACLLFFLPLADWGVLLNMQSSIHLYFQKFEFNASFYYLFAHISPWFTGWYEGATIGPVLAQITIFAVFYGAYWLFNKKEKSILDLQMALLGGTTLYLFNATTVHPWYIIVPYVCSIGIAPHFAFVWTFTAFLSYSHYIDGGRQEHFGWIALEYCAVLAALVWGFYLSKGATRNAEPLVK